MAVDAEAWNCAKQVALRHWGVPTDAASSSGAAEAAEGLPSRPLEWTLEEELAQIMHMALDEVDTSNTPTSSMSSRSSSSVDFMDLDESMDASMLRKELA